MRGGGVIPQGPLAGADPLMPGHRATRALTHLHMIAGTMVGGRPHPHLAGAKGIAVGHPHPRHARGRVLPGVGVCAGALLGAMKETTTGQGVLGTQGWCRVAVHSTTGKHPHMAGSCLCGCLWGVMLCQEGSRERHRRHAHCALAAHICLFHTSDW